MTTPAHLAAGRRAEQAALTYLLERGLALLCRNYRCRQGEIDLVMQHGPTLVFVEVRYRHDDRFGGGAHSITRAKQRRLWSAARHFLVRAPRHAVANELPHCRFDVVLVSRPNYGTEIAWIQDAFTQDD